MLQLVRLPTVAWQTRAVPTPELPEGAARHAALAHGPLSEVCRVAGAQVVAGAAAFVVATSGLPAPHGRLTPALAPEAPPVPGRLVTAHETEQAELEGGAAAAPVTGVGYALHAAKGHARDAPGRAPRIAAEADGGRVAARTGVEDSRTGQGHPVPGHGT